MMNANFTPYYGRTVNVASSAGNGLLTVVADARAVMLVNVGTQLVFFRVRAPGTSTNASNADVPLPAGSTTVVLKDSFPGSAAAGAETQISIFGTAAGSTIYATPGAIVGL